MDESLGGQAPHTLWLEYALTNEINSALRRELRRHFPTPVKLARLLQNPQPKVQTDDAQFNVSAVKALAQRASRSTQTRVQTALDWCNSEPDNHIIGLDNASYPPALLDTADAPPVLYVTGNPDCLTMPSVAVVGARKASHAALELAYEFSEDLAARGICVVSGLAKGIDAAAHHGALAGGGQTTAVLATGANRTYPSAHISLSDRISKSGALVTEFPLFSQLRPYHFPRRNRIISGLSLGVLVVEAALPSGSLTTAQHALKQGREVMAVPGSIANPLTRGCHELLRNGAALVESTDDILHCLESELRRHLVDSPAPKHPAKAGKSNENLRNLPHDTLTLLDCLGFDPVSIDTLIRRSGLDTASVSTALTQLELSGVIVAGHGGRYTRCKQSNNPG